MSTPSAGGPTGPNVPPPPPGSFDQTQPPSGQFNQPGPYGASGSGPGGPPQGPGYGGPPVGGPGGQPPKKGRGKTIFAVIAGVVALIVLLCCIGGFFIVRAANDDSPSTTSTTESQSSTEPSSSSSAAASDAFPDEFDGWKRGTLSNAGGQQTAIYQKGSDTISVVVSEGVKPSDFEMLWDDDKKVGDASCGSMSSTSQCAGEKDGKTYLVTTATGQSVSDLADVLTKYLEAV